MADDIEQKFIAAITANSNDAEARSVYADWLDDQGDLRGEYLRLEAQLRTIPVRLAQLTQMLDPAWLVQMTRTCDVVMLECGPNKINVIKATREVTGLGLKDAKDLVEARMPQTLRMAAEPDDAKFIAAKFHGTGARVVIIAHGAPIAHSPQLEVETLSTIVITGVDRNQAIMAIKAVREVSGLGLKEAKDLVDAVIRGERRVVAREVSRNQTAEIVSKLRATCVVAIES